MDREAARVRQALRRGFGVWATTAAVAPLVGLFLNVFWIADSFPGISGSADNYFIGVIGRMAEACIPTAFSLLPAIFGCWALHYFEGELERMETEIGLAKSLLLASFLSCVGRMNSLSLVSRAMEREAGRVYLQAGRGLNWLRNLWLIGTVTGNVRNSRRPSARSG